MLDLYCVDRTPRQVWPMLYIAYLIGIQGIAKINSSNGSPICMA